MLPLQSPALERLQEATGGSRITSALPINYSKLGSALWNVRLGLYNCALMTLTSGTKPGPYEILAPLIKVSERASDERDLCPGSPQWIVPRVTGNTEVPGPHSQFLVCRQTSRNHQRQCETGMRERDCREAKAWLELPRLWQVQRLLREVRVPGWCERRARDWRNSG